MSPRHMEDYNEGWFARQTPAGLFFKGLGALIVVALVCGGVSWAGGWLKTGADVVGPKNVTKQWEFAYTYEKSLRATAVNWCSFRKAELQAGKTGDRVAMNQRSDQRLAVETLFDKNKAEYDAALANAFKAKLVRPPDVPTEAPTLQEKLTEVGCTESQP